MLQELIAAVILGVIGGVIPGPVLAATFTEIIQSGFMGSWRIIWWATIAETSVALINLILLSSLGLSKAFFYSFSFVGAIVLLWIAKRLWAIATLDIEHKIHFGGWQIAAMIFTNGALWMFWITVCIPKAIALGQQVPGGQYLFITFYEIAWVGTTVAIAYVFHCFRHLLSHPKTVPIIFKIFTLIFVYFAINMIYSGVSFFLSR
ncbi:MAG: hypothetical protein KBC81_02990 [Candidatus Pacebacteria bacterium]|nr:hypothetical protein [Candidatus Paceibacterota bacterium]